jgi:hypothetical protein
MLRPSIALRTCLSKHREGFFSSLLEEATTRTAIAVTL